MSHVRHCESCSQHALPPRPFGTLQALHLRSGNVYTTTHDNTPNMHLPLPCPLQSMSSVEAYQKVLRERYGIEMDITMGEWCVDERVPMRVQGWQGVGVRAFGAL